MSSGLRFLQHELAEPLGAALLERVALVLCPGGQVERRLGVRRQHEERLARLERGHPALRHRERQRAGQPARIEGRHNREIVNAPWSLAAVLAASEPERLYSGLSLLVSAAADGRPCGGLATFRALELLL